MVGNVKVSKLGLAMLVVAVLIPVGCGGPTAAAADKPGKILSSRELVEGLDLTKLPTMHDAKFNIRKATELSGNSVGTVPKGAEFYIEQLGKLGFKPGSQTHEKTITAEYAQVIFNKNGIQLGLTVMPQSDGVIGIQLFNQGEYQAKQLPKPAGAKEVYIGPRHAMYTVDNKVPDAAKELEAELVKAGWQPFVVKHQASEKSDERETLQFRQQGSQLSASIAVAPAQGGKTLIMYFLSTFSHDFPTPADAANVELDDNRWELDCTVPRDIKAVAEDFRKLLTAAGNSETKSEEPSDTRILLRFLTPGKDVLMVSVEKDKENDGSSKVRAFGISAEMMERMMKQSEEEQADAEKALNAKKPE